MDIFWKEALKVTGPIAVIGFLIWYCLQKFFSTEVLKLFTTEQQFTIVAFAICMLLIILLIAVRRHYQNNNLDKKPSAKSVNVTNSNIKGDIVMGNKTTKNDDI